MKMFVMTGKIILSILIMTVLVSVSIFVVGCGEAYDEEEEEIDPGDASAISSVLVIPDAREREGDPPPPSRSLSAPDVNGGLGRVNSSNGSTFLLPFRYETIQKLLGYYIQIQGADVYFDVPYRGTSSTRGEIVITISIPTNVTEGSFTVVYCVYDAQERVSNIIRTTVEVVRVGTGTLQISLSWDNEADLDLWVTDPSNNEIFFDQPSSPTGGTLDRDDIDGFGPENVYWDEDAPDGNYIGSVYIFLAVISKAAK